MTQATDAAGDPYDGTLAFYIATKPGELPDLEVAAAAAIQWAQGLKAAAAVLDPSVEYRVTLVAARPGSSNWIAKLEQLRQSLEASAANQAVEKAKGQWQKVPLIARVGLGLAVVVPLTAKPTIDYWIGNDGFSETQKREMMEIYEKVAKDPSVSAHRKKIYKEAPRDRKITGIGTGVPTGDDWKPRNTLPANQFAEADGLFEPQKAVNDDSERVISQTLDVILVTPRLENARRTWTFRQEGIAGTINAEMADKKFLAALEKAGVRETLRANIPMRIRLEIKQKKVDGEWKVPPRGRKVVEVVSPTVG